MTKISLERNVGNIILLHFDRKYLSVESFCIITNIIPPDFKWRFYKISALAVINFVKTEINIQ